MAIGLTGPPFPTYLSWMRFKMLSTRTATNHARKISSFRTRLNSKLVSGIPVEQTFFKQSSKGIKGGGGMSLGIMFRSAVSLCEVNKKTGCLLHLCEKEQTEKDKVLLDYR